MAASVRVTAAVGDKAQATRRRLARPIERTRKGYLLHHPLLLLLRWLLLLVVVVLLLVVVVVGRVRWRQVERVLLHSQTHH